VPILPEKAALSFGADARRYDSTRPGYPQDLIDRIVATAPGPRVLDAGCGTGKVAVQLRAAGCDVLGVEPDPRMAQLAVTAGIPVEIATFEQWDPAGRQFDAVVAGQSWHWVDPAEGAAKAALATRPGGLFTVFWNAGQPPADLARQFADAYTRILPEVPAARAGDSSGQVSAADGYARLGAQAFAHTRTGDAFGPMREWRFPWRRHYTRDEWLALVPTSAGQDTVAPDRMAALLDAIGAVLDTAGGGFDMEYTTVALAAERLPG
jgi:SAM-dependent methyltransferase